MEEISLDDENSVEMEDNEMIQDGSGIQHSDCEFKNSECWREILNKYQDSVIQSCSEKLAVLRMSLSTGKEAETFISFYSTITKTNWIVCKEISSPQRLVYSKSWYCQHSKKNKNINSKRNANCGAVIKVIIKKLNRNTIQKDRFLKLDPPLSGIVRISIRHSHTTSSAKALRMLRVKEEVKQQFFEYFDNAMTPAVAIRFHEKQYLMDGDFMHLADASVNPTLTQVKHLYKYWYKLNLGSCSNPLKRLKGKTKLYEDQGTQVKILDEGEWAVAIVTPIMKRVQQLQEANEMVFIDSTCSCESTSTILTVVLVATKIGALPVAVLIHRVQTTESYTKAFQLLKENFPCCFGGNSDPKLIMTDDSPAEKNALINVWPKSTQLLCHFHVAQAEWKWIFSQSSKITEEERPRLMKLFQSVMYSNSEEVLSASVENLWKENAQYPEFVQRFMKFFKRRSEWVLLDRLAHLTRDNNPNNLAEASIGIIKDIVLYGTKAWTPVALCEFLVTTWELYFKKKLLDFSNFRNTPDMSKSVNEVKIYQEEDILKVKENEYKVRSSEDSEKWYTVHTDIGVCNCFSGSTVALCKHQYILFERKKIKFPNAAPISAAEKQKLAALALGPNCPSRDFFEDFLDIIDEMDGVSNVAHQIDSEVSNTDNQVISSKSSTSSKEKEIAGELDRIKKLLGNASNCKMDPDRLLRCLKGIK